MNGDTARMLDRYGVITLQVFKDDKARQKWEDKAWDAMDEFPEYRKKGKKTHRVLGGFGALANPSSFHHPTIQKLRTKIKQNICGPLLKEYAALKNWDHVNYEMLYDRLCVRYKEFGTVGKETWHRDIYDGEKFKLRELPASLPNNTLDIIFGGWLNLSADDQYFVCQVGSHKGEKALRAQKQGGGFALVDGDKAERELKRQAGRKIGNVRTNDKGHIIVPPGHIVMFPQSILHGVFPGKSPNEPKLRLFMGHRLTREQVTLFSDLERVIMNNEVPRIPSGQIPPMYSQNHYAQFSSTRNTYFRNWGENTFRSDCLYERMTSNGIPYKTPGSRNDKEPWFNTNRSMPSLLAMSLPSYQYSRENVDCLTPQPLSNF